MKSRIQKEWDFFKSLIPIAVLFAIGLILWKFSNTACAIVVFELPYLLGIFLSIFAIGYITLRATKINYFNLQETIIISLAIGSGILPQIVHIAGLAGIGSRYRFLWVFFTVIASLIGMGVLLYIYQNRDKYKSEYVVYEQGRHWMVLLFIFLPFVVLGLLCAAIPPGVLWSAEGGGYDVLEYHLQVPKEWFQLGNITHLSHNVYANFPLNAEMLYLLGMYLKGRPLEAIYLAQLIHFTFGILFVLSVWAFTRRFGIKSAVFASILSGTTGWLIYLGVLAYNELGMVFVGSVGVGVLVKLWFQEEAGDINTEKLGLIVGILLGGCAGFKYTAIPMIAVPVSVVAFITFWEKSKFLIALKSCVLLGVVALVVFSPYLVRNFYWTGNPIFPLGYSVFDGKDFTPELAARWEKGHRAKGLPTNDYKQNLLARFNRLYSAGLKNVIVDNFLAEYYRSKGDFLRADLILRPPPILDLPKFGFGLILLPWFIFLTRKQSGFDWLLVFVLVFQTGVWLFFTHMQARFLIPWLIILPYLVARTVSAFLRLFTPIGILTFVILLGTVFLNFRDTFLRYQRHVYVGTQKIDWSGQHRAFTKGIVPGYEYLKIVNSQPEKKILLVGEATPFYIESSNVIYNTVFNRNLLGEHLKESYKSARNYICSLKPDFIYVNWAEIRRLRSTYGFDESIKPGVFYYLGKSTQYKIRKLAFWKPMIKLQNRRVPSRILYKVEYKKREERHIKRRGKWKYERKRRRR